MLIRKIILFNFIFLTLLACKDVSEEQLQNSFDYVPENTSLIIEAKDFSNFEDFAKENPLLENLIFKEHKLFERTHKLVSYIPHSSGLLSFSQIGNKNFFLTFIENKAAAKFTVKPENISDSVTYEQKKIYQLKDKDELYFTQLNNLNILSESKLIIENCIRNYTYGIEQKIDFTNLRKTINESSPSLFFNSDQLVSLTSLGFHPKQFPIFKNLFGWSAFDLKFNKEHVRLSGVYPFTAEDQHKIHLLNNQDAIETSFAKFVPMNAIGVESYSINKLDKFTENKKRLRLPYQEEKITALNEFVEVGKIHWKNKDALFFQSAKPSKSFEYLNNTEGVFKNFRDQKIYELEIKNDIFSVYSPLIAFANAKYFTQLGEYFIVTEDINLIENIIISYQNQNSLGYEAAYKKTINAVSEKQNAIFISLNKNLTSHLSKLMKPNAKKLYQSLSFEAFEVGVFQVNMKENFAYFNFEMQQANETSEQQKVYLKKRIKSKNPIVTPPKYFTNWRTSNKEIIFQDENNNLQLLDADGEILWKKNLGERLLGPIKEIDIYKNTRIQILASTPSALYLLDRKGNEVSPFPYKWKEGASLETAVFDYDNLGKYRFFTSFENKLKLKDRNNKNISGFKFTPTKSDLASPPKHFRIGRKDYILVKEKNNQLHILDRTGKQRVKFSTEVEFSNQEWFLYDDCFTSTSNNGELIQIKENGEVKVSEPKFETGHKLAAKDKILAVISDNQLHINEVSKKLDYGIYTQPQIFEIGEDTFISITDQQANKVYLFNEHGHLMPSFPVFGTSAIDLIRDSKQKLNILVKGEDNSVLIYEY